MIPAAREVMEAHILVRDVFDARRRAWQAGEDTTELDRQRAEAIQALRRAERAAAAVAAVN